MSCGLSIIICYRFREYPGSESIVASSAGRAEYSDLEFKVQAHAYGSGHRIMPRDQRLVTDQGYTTNVCKRLRAFREDAGIEASAVAEHLRIPTALYVLYEEYELVPHQLIPPLCEFLNLSPWYYLTGLSDKYSPPFRSGEER